MLYFEETTTEEEWNAQLTSRVAPWAEMELENLVFTVPRTDIAEVPYERIIDMKDYWNGVINNYSQFRDQSPDLFKERGIVDIQLAYGYMYATYPMNGPLPEARNLFDKEIAYSTGSWGWLHEIGHRYERGNSYGPERGALWTMFERNVDVFTNVFTCVGITSVGIDDKDRCIANGGAEATISGGTWADLGFFERLDFYNMIRDGFSLDSITQTIIRGRKFRFPLDDTERRVRLWLLLSEFAGRNLAPLFNMYGIEIPYDYVYEQIILSDDASLFLRFASETIEDLSEYENSISVTGVVSKGLAGPERLFASSESIEFGGSASVSFSLSIPLPSSSFSLSFWLRVDSNPSEIHSLIELIDNWKIAIAPTGLLSFLSSDLTVLATTETSISSGEWFHIALVRNGESNDLLLFLDGELDSSSLFVGELSISSDFQMLLNGGGISGAVFDGSMAELALFDYALPAERVLAHSTPSPFHFKPWISSQYSPDPIQGCDVIPQEITSCHTKEGLFDTNHCELCLEHRCNDGPVPDGGDCSDVCLENEVMDAFSGACMPCHESCASCSLPNLSSTCSSCYPLGEAPYLEESRCVASCSLSYFLEIENEICSPCHATCQTCSGALSSECDVCVEELVWDENSCLEECSGEKVLNEGICLQSCPGGKYADNELLCQPCNESCLTCSGSAGSCDSCAEGENELFPFFTPHSNSCSEDCDTGYFNTIDSYTCELCADVCNECEGVEDFCISCKQESDAPYFFLNSCVNSCPPQTTEESFVCHGCDINGSEPFEESNGNCVADCGDNQVIHEFACRESCPIHYFEDEQSVCQACDANCNHCETTAETCISCKTDNGFPALYESVCLETCPPQFFESQNRCESCLESCHLCSDGISCDSCLRAEEGGTLPFFLGGECLVECPTLFYPSLENTCESCHSSCASCGGDLSSECLSCPDGTFLQEGSCVAECSTPSTFGNAETNTCELCNDLCQTCEGEPTFCTSCHEEGEFPVLELNSCEAACNGVTLEEECLTSCPEHYFEETNSAQCLPCLPTCQNCVAEDSCTTCDASSTFPYFLENDSSCIADCRDFGKVGYEFECVVSCPPSLFDDGIGKECMPCSSGCISCDSSDSCSTCDSLGTTPILFEGVCMSECPLRFYELGRSACLPCPEHCSSCSQEECSLCDNGFHIENGACVEDVQCEVEVEEEGAGWGFVVREMEIESTLISSPFGDFQRNFLCVEGTHEEEETCIPYGSRMEGKAEISFVLSLSITCQHQCDSSSTTPMNILQSFETSFEVHQNSYHIMSAISSLETLNQQFQEILRISLSAEDTILQSLYSEAESRLLESMNVEVNRVCGDGVWQPISLQTSLTEPSPLELVSIGTYSEGICEITLSPEELAAADARCICDESAEGLVSPCTHIESSLFTENSICHPNHCTNGGTPDEFITLTLDASFADYNDNALSHSIDLLRQWVFEHTSILYEIRVFKVNKGSVVLLLDVARVSTSNTQVLEDLYVALGAGTIDMDYPIVSVELSFLLSSSSPSFSPSPFPTSVTILVTPSSSASIESSSIITSALSPSAVPSPNSVASITPSSSTSMESSLSSQTSTSPTQNSLLSTPSRTPVTVVSPPAGATIVASQSPSKTSRYGVEASYDFTSFSYSSFSLTTSSFFFGESPDTTVSSFDTLSFESTPTDFSTISYSSTNESPTNSSGAPAKLSSFILSAFVVFLGF